MDHRRSRNSLGHIIGGLDIASIQEGEQVLALLPIAASQASGFFHRRAALDQTVTVVFYPVENLCYNQSVLGIQFPGIRTIEKMIVGLTVRQRHRPYS